jgi:hypothetical protein
MYPLTALRATLYFTSLHFSSLVLSTLQFTLLCYSFLHLTSLHFLPPSLPLTVFHFPNPRFENMRLVRKNMDTIIHDLFECINLECTSKTELHHEHLHFNGIPEEESKTRPSIEGPEQCYYINPFG